MLRKVICAAMLWPGIALAVPVISDQYPTVSGWTNQYGVFEVNGIANHNPVAYFYMGANPGVASFTKPFYSFVADSSGGQDLWVGTGIGFNYVNVGPATLGIGAIVFDDHTQSGDLFSGLLAVITDDGKLVLTAKAMDA